MSDRPIVIVHGWSDAPASFAPLARLLRAKLNGRTVFNIHLADYISMDDEVRFDDVVSAMAAAWERRGLPQDPRSVDAIVHSTGGLVIRDWLQRYYEPNKAPIKHLVMLAPANFGSPLAHMGRSMAGRIWKEVFTKRRRGTIFETGTHILKGLEMASPYTWDLAERDRFGAGGRMYSPGNVLCTVLVGQDASGTVSAVADEDGWDGTVRVASANMDCARTSVIFPREPSGTSKIIRESEASSGLTAFGVLDKHDHGSIMLRRTKGSSLADVERSRRNGSLFADIVKSLTVTDQEFEWWRNHLAQRNRMLLERAGRTRKPEKHGYQNTVVRVEDQYGVGIQDFLLEFFEKDDDRTRFSRKAHRAAFRSVHAFSDDKSYRSFYFNCTSLFRNIDKDSEFLGLSVSAHPEFDHGASVGFTPYGKRGVNGLRILRRDLRKFFVPNETLLLRIQLTRQQSDSVFELNRI